MTFEVAATRDILRDFVEYERGCKLRKALLTFAKKHYVPKHADKYLSFMNDHPCDFSKNHPQSVNHPYYFTLFTEVSQHVMGDCVEECLDKAIDASLK